MSAVSSPGVIVSTVAAAVNATNDRATEFNGGRDRFDLGAGPRQVVTGGIESQCLDPLARGLTAAFLEWALFVQKCGGWFWGGGSILCPWK
jgi:hypothetical protein